MFKELLCRFYYLKLCYNRFLAYISIPGDLIQSFLLLTVTLKVFGIVNFPVLISLGVVFLISALIFGHYEVKYKFAHMEQSVFNKINPELMQILQNTGGKSGRKEGRKKRTRL